MPFALDGMNLRARAWPTRSDTRSRNRTSGPGRHANFRSHACCSCAGPFTAGASLSFAILRGRRKREAQRFWHKGDARALCLVALTLTCLQLRAGLLAITDIVVGTEGNLL